MPINLANWSGQLLRLSAALAIVATSPVHHSAANAQIGPTSLAEAKADYQRKLSEYEAARQQYEEVAQPYWKSVGDKRQSRIAKRRNGELIVADDYVLVHQPKLDCCDRV